MYNSSGRSVQFGAVRVFNSRGQSVQFDAAYAFWLILRKNDRVIVGSADFKGIPDERGAVEIGYGLGKAFEHNGYMTEAVKSMCDWALRQSGVVAVIAETDRDGLASQRILEQCGFDKYDERDTIWWRLQGTRQ